MEFNQPVQVKTFLKFAVSALATAVVFSAFACSRTRRPNLLLISLDTVRADHCSVYDYALPTTPGLEVLATEGIVCDAAYSTTPVTGPSHATMFTGLMPQNHGLRVNGERLGQDRRTLAESLLAEGYQTAGVASSFALNSSFGLSRGFEFWNDDLPLEGSKHHSDTWLGHEVNAGFDRRADRTTEVASGWLRTSRDPDRPFFLFVHYFEPHGPYVPPDRWQLEFRCDGGSNEVERMIAAYDAGLAFTDDEVARLLNVLAELELAEDTMVVVTADHGEGLMTHGAMAHGPHLYDEAVHIPLIFRWPGWLHEGRRMAQPVSLTDLAPTILELLRVEAEPGRMDGRSFAPWLLSLPVEAEESPIFLFRGNVRREMVGDRRVEAERFGVVDGRWKFLTSEFEEDELFDLDADPGESTNLGSKCPQEVERLGALLSPWARIASRTDDSGVALSREEQRGLEVLGYGY